MATAELCEPSAQLMESMRAVGYSLASAIADLIDNSIAASAHRVDITFSTSTSDPFLTVLDNGAGMDPAAARIAMKLAGVSVFAQRQSTDLGRFGLGLKTASLSQCRRLTVVSKRAAEVTALSWDLDHMLASDTWSLLVLDPTEYTDLPGVDELLHQDSGTLVIWQKLDRLLGGSSDSARDLDASMIEVAQHISLVFHQFLAGTGSFPKTEIRINGNHIAAADPFLTTSPRTIVRAKEAIVVQGHTIELQSFTLPYLNKMTSKERERAGVAQGLRDSQGFYVYRGGRLVIWGTWFRLMPKHDLSKLARVKVDIPHSLDHLWSLDIKKSTAAPPAIVRDRLRQLAGAMVEPSHRIHRYRGRKPKGDDDIVRPWDLIVDRDGFRYEINRVHPSLAALAQGLDPVQLGQLEHTLALLEESFPLQDAHNRMSSDMRTRQQDVDEAELLRSVCALWPHFRLDGEDAARFAARMTGFEPWNHFKGREDVMVHALSADSDPV